MKPKANGHSGEALGASNDDYDEMSLYKAYETVGLLITESRIAERSAKGRREGVHIPQNIPLHKPCQDDNQECVKVRRYKEVIANLCYNGIPLCAEVLLCPMCEIGAADKCTEQTIANVDPTHEVGSAHSDSYVLLEQWTIQQVHSRVESPSQSLQNLCNAVRSQLCFSQLSAWFQMSQGSTPKHIFYRLTAPGEWFVHKFVMSPQSHKFPEASLGQSRRALRVTLSSLPRTSLTPYEISIASRDKLFAVKDASPLLRKSRRSFNNLEKQGEADGCDLGRANTTSERTHSRSKSVRGIQDLTGRKSAADSCHRTVTQRHSGFLSATKPPSSDLSAAEQLASFSAFPANSIDNLEFISCSTGTQSANEMRSREEDTPRVSPPPHRLSMASGRAASLKSPKVLFTRTTVRNNFFAVPSINCSSDLTSQLNSDTLADTDSDCQTGPEPTPQFNLGEENSDNEQTNGIIKNKTITEHGNVEANSTNYKSHRFIKSSTSKHCEKVQAMPNSQSNTEEVRRELLKEQTRVAASSQPYCNRNAKTSKHSSSERDVEPLHELFKNNQHSNENGCREEIRFRKGFQTNDLTAQNIDGAGEKVVSRRSRKHQSQEEQHTINDKDGDKIVNTPTNKKLQAVKHSQGNRSRLFKQRPLQSSPAPVKRIGSTTFGYDKSLNSIEAIKNALSCTSLSDPKTAQQEGEKGKLVLSSSAPAFTSAALQSYNSLLGNFEESLLNGRIDPAGVVDGFTVDIGASGSFCPKHVSLPVEAYFFNSLTDDDASSPYLGYVDLSEVSRRGYQIPRKGTLQITLFYPNHKVNKMFVVTYDLTDMPAKCQTFIRQKTIYAPCEQQGPTPWQSKESDGTKLPTYLRYLIHLRFLSTKSNKIFLHTDIRLIYARDKFEFDSRVASYELRSFVESPSNPKYSPL
ncbi:atos homolog protein A-like [Watersipora subatra]|uniref:atos homolog protein A-like n=1 Tax=Watersipora subatra TaxID=2589382 RepID=UPI00355B6740